MPYEETLKIIEELSKSLPHFPDGRINYTSSVLCPVISVFVKYKDRILLLKRSNKVGAYRGVWSTVAGYWDEPVSLKKKILEELKEEIGLKEEQIKEIYFGENFEVKDKRINKNWLIHPVLVEVKEEPRIRLDFEHIALRWIRPLEINNFEVAPGLDKGLKNALEGEKYL